MVRKELSEKKLLAISGLFLVLSFYGIFLLIKENTVIPTDDELLAVFDNNRQLFEKYADVFSKNPELDKISVSAINGDFLVESKSNSGADYELALSDTELLRDILESMGIRFIKRSFCRGDNCDDPHEILYYSYSLGFGKGIALNQSAERIVLVDDLSNYGTKSDPRQGIDNSTERVYKKIDRNWYLFGE